MPEAYDSAISQISMLRRKRCFHQQPIDFHPSVCIPESNLPKVNQYSKIVSIKASGREFCDISSCTNLGPVQANSLRLEEARKWFSPGLKCLNNKNLRRETSLWHILLCKQGGLQEQIWSEKDLLLGIAKNLLQKTIDWTKSFWIWDQMKFKEKT